MKPVRWGVLGNAKFARDHMAPAIHMAENAELAALGTSNPGSAKGWDFCPGLKQMSYEDLLADPSIDAIYIPLPNHMHVEWTLKVLAAGKHVLTEKPISMTAEEIDILIAERDRTGLLAAEAYMIVHHPQWQRARDLVQGGAIGKLLHVDAFFSYNNADELQNIRNRPETGGGGIRDIGVYTYGSARFVTGGEARDLSCRMIRENGVDVWAQVDAMIEGPLGRATYIAMTSMRMQNRQEVTFHGDKGLLKVAHGPFNANLFAEARIELHRDQTVTSERWPAANHYKLQVENFGKSIRTGATYPCPLEFTRGTQEMIDRAFETAREISW
ncbi:Gfo/Idh/MocA family oxidoreductase [Rhodobacter sp. HX-7-19]|uniref:Gfo/Idh/MocA family oxidoreductase n=1 Tax=Paragemmobacter kunshanensis TaxID=2583234 RepID=A0A6M1TNZ3_9RHOB|nr:Gfo/Idh/MocA family oxidoreductase [Rhodobacter kunshanensis]NGQ89848.1 Gfo/Idh/MocA family oxidoreductase [Rhodobacter kunshanensis]